MAEVPIRPSARLPAHVREEIDHWLANYPPDRKRSAVLWALHAAQHENGGHVTVELMDGIADYLDLPPIAVYEVATFYSMIETHPVGRHNISVCTNISCMLNGADEIVAHLEQKLGCHLGESTADGRIFLKREEECLAACVGAPMMMINHKYYEHLTLDKVDELIDGLE